MMIINKFIDDKGQSGAVDDHVRIDTFLAGIAGVDAPLGFDKFNEPAVFGVKCHGSHTPRHFQPGIADV